MRPTRILDVRNLEFAFELVSGWRRFHEGHDAAHLPEEADLVVASAAIPASNPELQEAERRGLPVVKYARALGGLMEGRRGIAVAGCHGKTTTTGMTAFVLERCGLDPSVIVGGDLPVFGGNWKHGLSPFLVAEACEYDRSFLNLSPEIAIVNNIDADHLDYYRDLQDISSAFLDFARRLPPEGLLVVNNEQDRLFRSDAGVRARVETTGLRNHADWTAVERTMERGLTRFKVLRRGEEWGAFALRIPGLHNTLNALGVIAVASHLGLDRESIHRALLDFPGVDRRLQVRYRRGGISVVDDYAHHPAEVQAVLRTLRDEPGTRRIWAVFQPHQASRLRLLRREMAAALGAADRVLVPDVFFARDSQSDRESVHSLDLVKTLNNLGADAVYEPSFPLIVERILADLRPGDVVVTMGAGNITGVSHDLARRLEDLGRQSIPA
ncbi:MAG: UDP-N-acetylmuramate--L-alanine ligase [Planctomycetaceae bacterium]|nr:UDP-N-acetylmuramate--L-alanine ligase [Planctomycetaceae bacterium]